MTPQDLKNSILQLAIKGKLVEQRAEEGTGEELYKKIQAEKKKLIKEGKIKKEKPLSEITEDEIPFDIPESWKWVKLGSIGETNIGLTYSPKNVAKDGTIVLRSSNIQNGMMNYDDTVRVDMVVPDIKMCRTGDILICARNGSKRLVGKAAKIDKEGMSFGAFMTIYRSICNDYILHIINSAYFRNSLLGDTGTTTINQITQNILKNFLVPLPPLAEQKRIVAKIEEFFPYINRYEEAWSKLEDFNERFPTDMQKSLLQYAIQGKLVEQREEEGTGEELYKQIQAEKKKLIKEGKIKKEKPLPEITEDEVPFDIPESWKWVRIGEVFSLTMGQSPAGESVSEFCDGMEFHQGKVCFGNKYLNVSPQKTMAPSKIAQPNSVLLCVRAPVGKVNITDREICIGRGLCAIYPVANMTVDFVYYLLATYENIFVRKASGTTFVAITGEVVKNQAVPLPPLAEQKRIVAKLEEMLPLCEKLK